MAKRKVDWKRRRLQRVEVDNGPIFGKIVDYRLPNPPEGMEGAGIPEHIREAIIIRSFAGSVEQFNFTLNRYESDLRKILEPYRDDLHNAPREAVDAFNALHNLDLLREGRDADDYDLAIMAGIFLGAALARAKVRPFEDDILHEIKRKEGIDERNSKRAKLGREIVHAVDELMERSRSLGHKTSERKACRELAKCKRFGDLNADNIRNKYKTWKK